MADRKFQAFLAEIKADVKNNQPIDATDNELHTMALLCSLELRYRLPEYAIRQGDLPEEYMDACRARQHMAAVISTTNIYEGIE